MRLKLLIVLPGKENDIAQINLWKNSGFADFWGSKKYCRNIYKMSKKYSKYVSRDYGQNFYYLIDFIRHENACTCTFMFIIENKNICKKKKKKLTT